MTGVKQGTKYPKATREQRVAWVEAVAAEEDGEGCRDWPWGQNSRGYGVLLWGGVPGARVTHIVLELSGRPRPPAPEHHALHSCDNPLCAAPWHLRWGNNEENVADKMERERQVRGVTHYRAKLSDDDVRAIRSSAETNVALAARYGMHKTTIGKIRRGLRWGHVA